MAGYFHAPPFPPPCASTAARWAADTACGIAEGTTATWRRAPSEVPYRAPPRSMVTSAVYGIGTDGAYGIVPCCVYCGTLDAGYCSEFRGSPRVEGAHQRR